MNKYSGVEIAIIGMAGRFPGADNIFEFWDNIKNGKESISFFSDEELISEGVPEHEIDNPQYVKANAYVSNKEYFDSAFFNYLKAEAKLMDPQMRLFHETCWKAIEDAGYDVNRFKNKIGLFAGASSNVNWRNYVTISSMESPVDSFSKEHFSNVNYLCARISHQLNLRGPSVFIDTACSTSLVAVQRASMSLLLRECDMALAGGVTIWNSSKHGYFYKEGMIRSKDGHCRAFDERSSGTVGGEGTGAVVLKRLKDALNDGDNIYALIKGSGINNDGKEKMAFTAPSVNGQYQVITKALKMAQVSPESISYVEAHGTGTVLGDPIEVEALNLAFGKSKTRYCALGSVKTNIGHTDAAAGIAGLIKTVMAVKHRQIPPSLHFVKPNPKINFTDSPIYINTELKEWKSRNYPLRAGVSSFGIGGTNAHIIIEEAPDRPSPSQSLDYQLLLFSAQTPSALKRNIKNFQNYLEENLEANLADIAYTLKLGRSSFVHKKAVVCKDTKDAIQQLSSLECDNGLYPPVNNDEPSVVFMFPGQGSQYPNLCLDLYRKVETFRILVDKCLEIVKRISGKDIKSVIFTKEGTVNEDEINNTEFAQPALFIVEYALAKLLIKWGIKPGCLIGHSIGEYVAACISGVFSLEDALTLVIKRGELMQSMNRGAMLSIAISESTLLPILDEYKDISLSVINSTKACVVSGKTDSILRFKKEIEKKGFIAKLIRTSHAFHSYMMDGILNDFENELNQINIKPQTIPFISNLTGKEANDLEISKSQYWVSHLRQTVRFSEGIETLMKNKNVVFIEVGPGKTLGGFVATNKFKDDGHKIINLLGHKMNGENDILHLCNTLVKLWLYGIEPNWEGFYENENRRRISIPSYSFDQINYPVHVNSRKMILDMIGDNQINEKRDKSDWFYLPTWKISPLVQVGSGSESKFRNLIYADNCGITSGLVEKFEQNNEETIIIKLGDKFIRETPNVFFVNPDNEEDYQKLFNVLAEDNMLPDRVIHCWAVNNDIDSELSENKIQNLNNIYFYSVFQLVKLMEQHGNLLKEINVISNNIHDVFEKEPISPVKSLSLGLLKVISQEYPNISTRHIDVSLLETITEELITKLFEEMKFSQTGKIVAYRNSHRFVQTYDKVNLGNKKTSVRFIQKGIYLITGGLGELGYNMSKYLASKFNAKLILLGTTKLPEQEQWNKYLDNKSSDARTKKKIERIKEIVNLGGEVLYICCDISSKADFSIAVKKSEEKFGRLNGVIHAAGIIKGESINFISQLNKRDFEKQFASKISGTIVLKEVLKNKELDFCLLTSSLSSILGGLKFAAYSSANVFMDYYVRSIRGKGMSKNWLSVNFDGISYNNKKNMAINFQDIAYVFNQILSLKDLPQVVVSTSDIYSRIKNWVNKEMPSDQSNDIVNKNMTNVKDKHVLDDVEKIEQIIKEYESVSEVVVCKCVMDEGSEELTAFVVSSNKSMGTFKLKRFLRNKLPDHMVPTSIVFIDKIPLNPNGEINRKALLSRFSLNDATEVHKGANKKSGIEIRLIEICKEILEIKNINLKDNFFDLGGNSLLLIRISEMVKKCFNVDIPLQYYLNMNLKQIANEISNITDKKS